MAVTKAKKKEILADIKESLKKAGSVVFVKFHALTVSEVNELRKTLRAKNVSYKVAKKTLITKALEEAKYQGDIPSFESELAVASGEDILDPAHEIYVFEKKFKDKISIAGGVFEGVYKNREEMVVIASIPGRQTLYAQFVNLINSPIQGLVIGLSEIAKTKPTN